MISRPLVLAACFAAVADGSQTPGSSRDLESRIPARRAFAHAARIVTEPEAATGRTKVWVLPGEDDMRLWSLKGAQMEMDFQVAYWLTANESPALPASVSFSFETHGETRPGPAPHALRLSADGRPLRLEERPEPMRRSGPLVFYATSAKMSLAEFLTLVNASRVQGRCWGHEFVLLPAQLEILRDLASRMRTTPGVVARRLSRVRVSRGECLCVVV